ncbi:SdpI family protein, partial [Staphylococcus lutrae]
MLLIGLGIISLIIVYLVLSAQKHEVGNKPNYFLGYRTPTSMKSKTIWDFSQKAFKKIFIKVHFFVLFIGSIWIIYDILNFPNETSIILQAVIYFI